MLGALTDFASCYWLLEALLTIAEIESRKTALTTTCDHLLLTLPYLSLSRATSSLLVGYRSEPFRVLSDHTA